MSPIQLTLYSRSYCHLCDQMRDALQPLREQYPFALDVVDVDADPALVAQYDELVPVLTGSINGASALQLCHYFLDEKKVRDFLISCQSET
jgi:thiol-disulfide isomerase/thioredoxin